MMLLNGLQDCSCRKQKRSCCCARLRGKCRKPESALRPAGTDAPDGCTKTGATLHRHPATRPATRSRQNHQQGSELSRRQKCYGHVKRVGKAADSGKRAPGIAPDTRFFQCSMIRKTPIPCKNRGPVTGGYWRPGRPARDRADLLHKAVARHAGATHKGDKTQQNDAIVSCASKITHIVVANEQPAPRPGHSRPADSRHVHHGTKRRHNPPHSASRCTRRSRIPSGCPSSRRSRYASLTRSALPCSFTRQPEEK